MIITAAGGADPAVGLCLCPALRSPKAMMTTKRTAPMAIPAIAKPRPRLTGLLDLAQREKAENQPQ